MRYRIAGTRHHDSYSGCLQLGFLQKACAIWLYFIEEDKVSDAKEIIGRMRKVKAE